MGDFGPAASWLEIDLDAVAANWLFLRARCVGGAVAGVLKADAYGVGAAMVAPKLYAAGCRRFFTAHLGEAVAIRDLVPGAMVAVLHGILPGEEGVFLEHGIFPVLCSMDDVALWRAAAAEAGRRLPALLHVDTGMARSGLTATDVQAIADNGLLMDGIDVLFVMTHLVSAEQPDDVVNAAQLRRFNAVLPVFPGAGASLANSSGIFLGREFTRDLARPGAALYGVNPTPGRANPMKPVVRLSARILQVRDVGSGESVGYNGTWTAKRRSRIAVVAVGYADGFSRYLSNAATALFDGSKIPLVGRVSMDLTTYDVTDVPAAKAGDTLELLGAGHDVDALAVEAGTNGYEILTSLGRRYQRRYIGVLPPA